LETASFSIDGSTLTFSGSDQGNIIFDPENNVLTIYLTTASKNPKTYKFLKFWAIPATFKRVKHDKQFGTQFHDTYEFKAKLFATEPRPTAENVTKVIELSCQLDYEL